MIRLAEMMQWTSLKDIISEVDLAQKLNIDIDLRAEQLSVNEYLRISEYLERQN